MVGTESPALSATAECVHCGLCTSACPTCLELGDENDSPRGRIHLMRAIAQGRVPAGRGRERVLGHLDRCLDCRSCETACPSGVRYGRLIESFRFGSADAAGDSPKPANLAENTNAAENRAESATASKSKRFDLFRDLVLFGLFPYPGRVRAAMTPVRWMQRLGMYGWFERRGVLGWLPGRLKEMATLVNAPPPATPRLPEFLPAKGARRARVAFFVGCVGDAMFRHVHWATLRVLQENGCEIVIPREQGCCGAIHYHAGDADGGRRMADRNVASFEETLRRTGDASVDAVICNHGGCGAMLQEYPEYWNDAGRARRADFSSKVVDVNAFLDTLGLVPPTRPVRRRVTYHASCHLAHAQGVHDAPKRILAAIPELDAVPLDEEEICCGSAGVYNLNQPEMAQRLMDRKMERILATGADAVLASNAGCLLQIEREIRRRRLGLEIFHPMEILDRSYGGVHAATRNA